MLGWMLKRGKHAQDADAGDTYRLDQPDTPAPVFAARAFKSALFGTPAAPGDETRNRRQSKAGRKAAGGPERGSGTPSRPPGILLTPGTATSRRKRVSFGNDVADTTKPDGGGQTAVVGDKAGERNARRAEAAPTARTDHAAAWRGPGPASDSEGDWEEDDEGDCCTPDVTVDLNEPYSQSGRYWKEEFEKYHQEARAEMEKLLKYKQLAKSYARQKDAEAIQLAECLRDEQQKVIDMERKMAENASQIASKHRQPSSDSSERLSKLSKQAALAAQYRHRVQELEQELDQHVRPGDGGAEGRGRLRRHAAASPTTQKTLVETKRELRRARTQLKELDALREQASTLRARLKAAEARASRHERDDLASGEAQIRSLKAQLDKAREESKRKTEELQQLKSDLQCSEASLADTNAVLQRAQAKITDLKREMRDMKAAGPDQARAGSWRSRGDVSQESASTSRGAEGAGQGDEGQGVYDSGAAAAQRETGSGQCRDDGKATPNALRERTNLGRPRWQPFVARSPRNRAHVGEDASRRPGAVLAATHPKVMAAPALPAISDAAEAAAGDASEVDLLRGGFSRVGGPDANRRGGCGLHHDKYVGTAVLGKVSRSRDLPPERRAAAVARIQRSMAEKERAPRRSGHDKENVRP